MKNILCYRSGLAFVTAPARKKMFYFNFEFFKVNQHASQHFIFEKFIQALGPSGESRLPNCKTKQSAKFNVTIQ